MKQQIYQILVNRVPEVREHYLQFRQQGGGRLAAFFYLLWLNLRNLPSFFQVPAFDIKKLPSQESESSLSQREEPERFAHKLSTADVISFDVFDTLVFRPFSEPADLFFLVGMELHYPDFKRIRMEVEERTRQRMEQRKGTREVTFEQIWEAMERETGIPKQLGMQTEWNYECRCCTANPYMLRVVQELKRLGKLVVVTSDMYLSKGEIQKLLECCGYGPFQEYFVSGDTGVSKSSGDLYERMRERVGTEKVIFHIGDHPVSDYEQARYHHIHAVYYPNIQRIGGKFRTGDLSAIVGSIYRGLVNAHLHNGLNRFSREYEYGYLYGGLFVTGYCRFIHEYAQSQKIEKLLFLSRDGAVLLEAYRRMYPQDAGNTEYFYWSRLAGLKLTARFYRYDYFRRFLFHKVNRHDAICEVVRGMELMPYLEPLCQEIHVDPTDLLTRKNAEKIQTYLLDRWDKVLEIYEGQVAAGTKYAERILSNCKSAAAVDIGWAASGAVMLDTAVNRIWKIGCKLTGIVAGSNSSLSPEPDAAETFRVSGQVVSYLFSQAENRDLWKFHDPGRRDNLYWELLLGAPEGSFVGFYPDENGDPICRFKEKPSGAERIREIHQGILDFVEQFTQTEARIGWEIPISGRDAYAPMLSPCSRKNKAFWKGLEDLIDDAHIG